MDHAEFLEDLDQGRLDESTIEEYLLQNGLTTEQKQFLHTHNLTVSMILNGRYNSSEEPTILSWMRAVNATLGGKLFTIV